MEMEEFVTTEGIVVLSTELGRYECLYDEFGKIRKKTYIVPDGEKREYHFDIFGKLIKEVSVSSSGQQSISEYIHDDKGKLIAKVNHLNGREYKYIYDENGRPIGAMYTDKNKHRTLTEYIYNDEGICINRVRTPIIK